METLPPKYEAVNAYLQPLLKAIFELPDTRERAMAIARLEECSHWVSAMLTKEKQNAKPAIHRI